MTKYTLKKDEFNISDDECDAVLRNNSEYGYSAKIKMDNGQEIVIHITASYNDNPTVSVNIS